MGGVSIYLAVALALTANLLIPEQLVTYLPCCYDDSGHVSACAAECCVRSPVQSIRGHCCDPITQDLRPASAPLIDQGKNLCVAPLYDVLATPNSAMGLLRLEGSSVEIIPLHTGLLEPPDLLPLHCRLNT